MSYYVNMTKELLALLSKVAAAESVQENHLILATGMMLTGLRMAANDSLQKTSKQSHYLIVSHDTIMQVQCNMSDLFGLDTHCMHTDREECTKTCHTTQSITGLPECES